MMAPEPKCPYHGDHERRIGATEDMVEKHERFHSWWDLEKVGDKITRTYNLLIGLVFLHGAVIFAGVIIGIKKGLF